MHCYFVRSALFKTGQPVSRDKVSRGLLLFLIFSLKYTECVSHALVDVKGCYEWVEANKKLSHSATQDSHYISKLQATDTFVKPQIKLYSNLSSMTLIGEQKISASDLSSR